ncbi:hypothetical protein LZ554_007238 [Drepanopeziza brunnea f. sp. 'monogermtubi']|nr:hypothetical protein LZ554_007238 [Drepanopeziza brunnea f. sp. 'monogermtubi']
MAGNTPPQNSGREDPNEEKADDDATPRAAASVFPTAYNNNNNNNTLATATPPPPSRSQHATLSILSEQPHSAATATTVQVDRTPQSPNDESKDTKSEKAVPSWLKAVYRKFPRKSSEKSQHEHEHEHEHGHGHEDQDESNIQIKQPSVSAPPRGPTPSSGSGSSSGASSAPPARDGGGGGGNGNFWSESTRIDALLGFRLRPAAAAAGRLGDEFAPQESLFVGMARAGGDAASGADSGGVGKSEDAEWTERSPVVESSADATSLAGREIPKEVIKFREAIQANPGMATHPFAIQAEAAIEALLDDLLSPTHELSLRNVKLVTLAQSQKSALDFQAVMEKQIRSEMREVYAENVELRGKLAAAEEQRGDDGDGDDAEKCQKKCQELEKRIEEMQAEINEYEDGNFMTEDDCAQMSADRDRKHQEDTEDLKADIKKWKREHSSLQNKFKELEKVHEQTKQELIVEKGSNSAVFREIKMNELKQANDKIEELEEENKRLKTESETKTKASSEGLISRDDCTALNAAAVQDAADKIKELENEVEKLKASAKTSSEDLISKHDCTALNAAAVQEAADKIKELEVEVEKLKASAKTSSEENDAELAALRQKHIDNGGVATGERIAALESQLKVANDVKDILARQMGSRSDAATAAQTALEKRIKDLELTLGNAGPAKVAELKRQIADLNDQASEITVLKAEVARLQRALEECEEEKAKTAAAGRTGEPVLDPTRVGYSPEAFEKYKSLAEHIERMNAEIRICRAEHRPKAEEINRAALEASKNMNTAWERKMETARAAAKVKKDAKKAKSAEKRKKRRQWAERVLDKAEVFKQRAKDAATARAAIAAQGGLAEIKKQAGFLEEETKLLEAKAKVREAQEKQAVLEADIKKLDEARAEDAKVLNPYKKWLADKELLDQSLPITHPDRVQARVDSRYAYAWQQVNGAIYAINDALIKMQAKRALYGKQEGDCAAATEFGNLAVRLATDFSKRFEDRKDPQLIARSALWAAIAQYYSGNGETAQKLLGTVVPSDLGAADSIICRAWLAKGMDSSEVETRAEGYYKGSLIEKRDQERLTGAKKDNAGSSSSKSSEGGESSESG